MKRKVPHEAMTSWDMSRSAPKSSEKCLEMRFTRCHLLAKLTRDLGLRYPSQSETLPGVELPQVGAAPLPPGHRARCCKQTHQDAEKWPETHVVAAVLYSYNHTNPGDFCWEGITQRFLEDAQSSVFGRDFYFKEFPACQQTHCSPFKLHKARVK